METKRRCFIHVDNVPDTHSIEGCGVQEKGGAYHQVAQKAGTLYNTLIIICIIHINYSKVSSSTTSTRCTLHIGFASCVIVAWNIASTLISWYICSCLDSVSLLFLLHTCTKQQQ